MSMKKVKCADCGVELEVFESANIHIPKFRCDGCLKRR